VHSPASVMQTTIPKAFARPSVSFDHSPADAELVCLLGDGAGGPLKMVEEAGILTVRPWLIPMKWAATWMIFVGVIASCMIAWAYLKLDLDRLMAAFLLFMLVGTWAVGIPSFLGILLLLNRAFAKKGDYVRCDIQRRTLELCQVGRTLAAGEIVAFSEVLRWYRQSDVWDQTQQTGVLVRGQDGGVVMYPLFRELDIPIFGKPRRADRLAGIFQVPVRRIKLSKSESRALHDC